MTFSNSNLIYIRGDNLIFLYPWDGIHLIIHGLHFWMFWFLSNISKMDTRNKQRHYPAKSICHFLDRDMEALVLYFWRSQGRRRAIAITSFIQAPFACTFPYVHSRGEWLWKVKVLLGIGYSPLLSTVTIYNNLERKCESGFLYKYAYLIFVTDTRTVSVEKKSVMWRNFKFLYMKHVEKAKNFPQVD